MTYYTAPAVSEALAQLDQENRDLEPLTEPQITDLLSGLSSETLALLALLATTKPNDH